MSAERRHRSTWRSETAGALASALVAFSVAVPVGTLTLAPLGARFAGLGVAAGLVGAAIGGLVACLAGGSVRLRSGPATASCLVVNALVATLMVMPGMGEPTAAGLPLVLAFAFLCVVLAGLLQILFGLLQLGNAIRFVPRPVLAGFRNGIAFVIAVTQLPPLLGLAHPIWRYDLTGLGSAVRPGSLLVGAITVASILLLRRSRFTAGSLFGGLIVGASSHHALLSLLTEDYPGATIGPLPGLHDLPVAWRMVTGFTAGNGLHGTVLSFGPAIGVALVGGVLSLLAARIVGDLTQERVDSNRVLVGQGLGNVLSGLLGGAPIAGSTATSLVSHRSGGRARLSAVLTSVFLVLAVATAAPSISAIPLAALAGVMLVIAVDMLDRSTLELVRDILAHAGKATESIADLVIVAAVAIASLVVNVLAGVAMGVAISVAIFAIKSSRKVVRRYATRATRQSLRQRSSEEMQLLQDSGAQIALFELEGQLFFGTSDRLAHEVADRAGQARFIILDCGRVNSVDATGAHVVGDIARRLARSNGQLVLTGLPDGDDRRRSLERGCPPSLARWMPDADRALEWCEEAVLAAAESGIAARGELPLERADLCRDMDATDVARLREAMVRESYPRGTILFREGDPGDCMYVLVQGAVSMVLRDPDDPRKTKRLVTFAPGVVFGELALLQRNARSADGICDTDCTVYSISRSALEELGERNHSIAIKTYRALALTIADRLRRTTTELRHVTAQ
jgi:sulfate permease, SulP family